MKPSDGWCINAHGPSTIIGHAPNSEWPVNQLCHLPIVLHLVVVVQELFNFLLYPNAGIHKQYERLHKYIPYL